jgi:hypothetical protein
MPDHVLTDPSANRLSKRHGQAASLRRTITRITPNIERFRLLGHDPGGCAASGNSTETATGGQPQSPDTSAAGQVRPVRTRVLVRARQLRIARSD